jgi:BMFP domain-containing protein YqiC
MNRHFLEFWGKALLEAAKSQKQLEDLAQWCQRGFLGFQDYTQLFKVAYGLNEVAKDTPDYFAMWKKAEEDFRESFKEYLNLLGMVPREEYAALARQYEELKEKVAELEFQRLIKKQGEQFQKFIKGLGESAKPEDPPA